MRCHKATMQDPGAEDDCASAKGANQFVKQFDVFEPPRTKADSNYDAVLVVTSIFSSPD